MAPPSDSSRVLSRVNAILVLVVLALAIIPAIYTLRVLDTVRADIPKETFYHARDLRFAMMEVAGLERTLRAVRKIPSSPDALASVAEAADLFFVRFDAYRRSYPNDDGISRSRSLSMVDRLQQHLDEAIATGLPLDAARFGILLGETDELLRRLNRDIAEADAATDAALRRGMEGFRQLRFEIVGSILVLTILSGIVVILLAQNWRSGLQVYEAFRRDGLTGLANRRGFNEWLQAHGLEIGHSDAFVFAVLDIDEFRRINSRLGHDAGDRLLKATARWLEERIGQRGVVVRWGGDEFGVALPLGSDGPEGTVAWLDALIANPPPFQIGPEMIRIALSGGTAAWPLDSEAVADVAKYADLALIEARDRGRGRIVAYDPSLSDRRSRIAHLRQGLERAVRTGELTLAWQPQVRLADHRVVAAEALLRWTDPTTGEAVSPGEFIPIAEDSDLIIDIDRWVIDKACRTGAAWAGRPEGPLRVAVNVSPRHFRSAGLVATIESALFRHRLPGTLLEVEITEGVLLADHPTVSDNLARLSALGVRIALDDFGTGYSNLAYLTRLRPDVLKIDRSFLCEADPRIRGEIVNSMLRLAEALGAETLAEGVAREADLRFLTGAGCQMAQGFHFAAAMPDRDFLAWCRAFEDRTGDVRYRLTAAG